MESESLNVVHTREQSSVQLWGGPTTSYALECLTKYKMLLLSQKCKLTRNDSYILV